MINLRFCNFVTQTPIMKKIFFTLTICFISFFVRAQVPDGYELVWSDEFNGNGAIENSKWHHQTQIPNGGSWYNGEIQHYTNREENSFVSNGTLKVMALKETFSDQGVTKTHTSARLNSKFAFTYGYVAVRAKLPTGVGTWPAIWMLGQNINEPGGYWTPTNGTTSWPACGEIDIMEHWGSNQNYVQSATHTPSSFGNTVNKGGSTISTASTNFHIYSLEWTPERLIFRVDGTVHYTYEPSSQNASKWPFDLNQYLLLNVAILPEISPSFTQSAMEIDYVRVYQDASLSISDSVANDKLTLLPNPASDSLRLQVTPAFIGAKATVFSALGQKIDSLRLRSTTNLLDVSRYSKGLYFITVEQGELKITQKFIKQ